MLWRKLVDVWLWTYKAVYCVVYHACVSTRKNSELITYRLSWHINGSGFASHLPDGAAWCPLLSSPADTWWRHQMETCSTSLALCEWNPPVTDGFPPQRPLTRSLGDDLRQNKQLSKQSRRRWFETPSRWFWRNDNVYPIAWCIRWRKLVSMGYYLIEQLFLWSHWAGVKTHGMTSICRRCHDLVLNYKLYWYKLTLIFWCTMPLLLQV